MGFSNISGCVRIHNYEQAQAHWDRTPLPGKPGSKLRATWYNGNEARPLDDAAKWHYRLERGTTIGSGIGAADYYDVCLYHTEMVCYWRPEENGDRRVDYTNYSSNLSKQFMRRMGFGPEMKIGDVVVPVAYKELGTTIWRDANGRLIKEKSCHAPVYRYVSSPEQKAWRKTLKESTRNLVTLFEMGMTLPVPGTGKWGRHNGAPFKGVDVVFSTREALRHFDGEVHEGTTHEQIEALKYVWDACLQFLVDRRDYKAHDTGSNWRPKKAPPYKAPTPQEVTRSWYKQLERLCSSESPASERIPDWPTAEQLPKAYHF